MNSTEKARLKARIRDLALEFAVATVELRREFETAEAKDDGPSIDDMEVIKYAATHANAILIQLDEAMKALDEEEAPTLTPPENAKTIACDGCNTRFDVSKYDEGQKVRCGRCCNVLTVPA